MKFARLKWIETPEGYTLALDTADLSPSIVDEIETAIEAAGFKHADQSRWTAPADPAAPLRMWHALEDVSVAVEMETATLPPILAAELLAFDFH